MAVIINNGGVIPTGQFEINTKRKAAAFQANAMGTNNVAIYNIFDTRQQLLASTPYGEFTINGSTFASQEEVLVALVPVLFTPIEGAAPSVSFGDITGAVASNANLVAEFALKADVGTFAAWADITGKPTTVAGFGITDAYTDAEVDSGFISSTVGSGTGFSGAYLQFTGDGASNNEYIAINDTTNGFYFNMDVARQNTTGNANVYAGAFFEGGDAISTLYLGVGDKAADSDLLDGSNSTTLSTPSTVAVRDSSGDINARLFRSEYDSNNATIGHIMTQIETTSNNYIRPTTPATFRTEVIDSYYLPTSGNATYSSGTLTFTPMPTFSSGLNSMDYVRLTNSSDGIGGTWMRFNGTNTFTTVFSGQYYIQNNGGSNQTSFDPTTGDWDMDSDLNVDGTITCDTLTATNFDFPTNLNIPDGNSITWGTGQDMQIFHSSGINTINLLNGTSLRILDNSIDTRFTITASGNVTVSGTVTASSDIRLKENIQPITGALDKVCSLGGYTWDRIDTGHTQTGVIAQEVQAVLPEAVSVEDNEEGTLSVAYGNMVGILIEAVKELREEVKQLKENR